MCTLFEFSPPFQTPTLIHPLIPDLFSLIASFRLPPSLFSLFIATNTCSPSLYVALCPYVIKPLLSFLFSLPLLPLHTIQHCNYNRQPLCQAYLFDCLLKQISHQPITRQQLNAFRYGQDDLLKKGVLHDSETQIITCCKHKYTGEHLWMSN